MMEDKYKNIIEDAQELSRKWNVLVLIFGFPALIGFLLFGGFFVSTFGKSVSLSGELNSVSVTGLEYLIGLPNVFWGWLFVFSWFLYSIAYRMMHRNIIKAYLLNQLILLMMVIPIYYSIFYGIQFFVPFLLVRVLNWLMFVASVVYIFWQYVSKTVQSLPISSHITSKQLSTVLLVLWGISALSNLIHDGFQNILASVLLAAMPIFPPIIVIVFTLIFRGILSTLLALNILNADQEKYRKKFGYSVEDWYGKKSKQYKESLGE